MGRGHRDGEREPVNVVDRLIQKRRFRAASSWVPSGARLLDIGAHGGDFFDYLGDRIGPSVGLDPEVHSDYRAGRHSILAGYFPERAPQEQFDAASLLAVVEHLDDDTLASAARSLAELVRAGGRVIVTMPSPSADGLLDTMQRVGLIHGMDLEAHRQLTVESLIDIWAECGLQLFEYRRFEFGLNNLAVFKVSANGQTAASDDAR